MEDVEANLDATSRFVRLLIVPSNLVMDKVGTFETDIDTDSHCS